MLHSAKFLCSVAAAVARLLHALLMSLCSPRTPPAALQQVHAIVAKTKLARPAAMAVPEDEKPPPPVLVLPALFKKGEKEKGAKAARGRPSRLVIPPPPPVAAGCAAGFDPFGEAAAADRVAAEVMEEQGEGFCVASRRGVRHAMEDAYGVVADQICGESRMAFYGVYDGHGGRAAVDLVAERLGKNVVAAAATASRGDELGVMAAIRAGYLTTDNEFLSQGLRGGCCAATALLKDGDLYVANAGDCRAVLGTRSGAAVALTSDHTPARDDERRRIESRGGYVSKGSGGVWRVQGTLAVSRALGDADMRAWGVTGVPEVRAPRRVTPDCAFLVLASDGVWSKVSDQEAVDAVNRSSNLQYSESESESESMDMQCCKALVALARSRGSRDDITAMVVDLQRFLILPR